MTQLLEKLNAFLAKNDIQSDVKVLSADASTREYFRIEWFGQTAVACVYPEAFNEQEHAYVDVTKLFLRAELPVAELYAVDGELGVIVQEDLGDNVLREYLKKQGADRASRSIDEAIALIVKIQLATPLAFEMASIASRLSFDEEKLLWELDFFKTHYFETYAKRPLSETENRCLSDEFVELARDLASRATVLCHRDFHAANLMIDAVGEMRIIDHQDARIGSAAYDLVSFLLDRITEPPSPEWLAEKRRYFLDLRVALGLPRIDEGEFAAEFRLQTLQRCLKAVGTFSYQSAVRGKTHFIPFIVPMFKIVLRSAGNLRTFPTLCTILKREIEFASQ
ncbi:MAG TPA: phosphotransferase [Pyrinomonadaceae bacterium]|nr:phosphotransferase [Pyrinomonadaceae bacterium]